MTSRAGTGPVAIPANLWSVVAQRAQDAGVFAGVITRDGMVECEARESAAPAFYRVAVEDGRLWVSLVTEDRWLSQSIEQDLVHTGDKLDDLLDEELTELLGVSIGGVPFQHFRSAEKLFTFRSEVPESAPGATDRADLAAKLLLAYESCFRQLGDMEGGDEDE